MRDSVRRLVMVLLAFCSALALGAVASLFYLHRPGYGLPYRDSFAVGKAGEWEAFGGTWAVYDGGIRNDSDERGAKLMTGTPVWSDYLLEADVKLLGEDGDAGLIVRGSDEEEGADSYSGYYIGLRTRDNRLTLGLADHGWQELSAPMPESVQAFRWYHLKVLARGCHIVASADLPRSGLSITSIAVDDTPCLKSGRIGLRSYSSGGIWRNVRVRQASDADLHAMLAGSYLQQQSGRQTSGNDVALLGSGSLPSHVTIQPKPPNTAIQSISTLRLASSSHPVRATIRGVVTLTTPVLYVQDSSGGAAVRPFSSPPLKVGDEVRVTGRVEPQNFSTAIHDASIQLLWARTPLPPVSVTPSQAATGAFAAMFIEVEGLLSQKERGAQNTLELR